jgi:hypothetical protein
LVIRLELWPKWDAFGVGSRFAALAAGAEAPTATTAANVNAATTPIVLLRIALIVASSRIGLVDGDVTATGLMARDRKMTGR